MHLQKVTVFLITLIVVGLLGVAFKLMEPVLVPLVIAVIFLFVLGPAVDLLGKIHVPRPIAIVFVIIVIVGLFFLVGLFFYTSFQSFVRVYPRYQEKIQRFLQLLSTDLTARFGVRADLLSGINWPQTIRGYVFSLSGSFVGFVKEIFVVTIFLIFLMLERPFLQSKLEAAFEQQTSTRIGNVIDHITHQIGRYLTLKLIISAATGFLVWLALSIIGMDFPIVWALIGFLLNFVPSIGSILHFLIVSAMAFIQFFPNSIGKFVAVVVSLLTIHMVIGNFIDPRLQGRRLDLSPFLVLFALVFWGWLWGAVGMLLATPIVVAIKIVCENVPALAPVAVLMGKRPRKPRIEDGT